MTTVNQTELLGDLIPEVYIDTISLESSGGQIRQRNPHIDFTGEAKFSGISDSESEILTVRTNVIVKDKYEKNGLTSWITQEGFSKYLKIITISSSDARMTSELATYFAQNREFVAPYLTVFTNENMSYKDKIRQAALPTGPLRDLYDSTVEVSCIYASEVLSGESSSESLARFGSGQDSLGNYTYNVSYSSKFEHLCGKNPDHLTIFAYSMLDLNKFSNDNNLNLDFSDNSGLGTDQLYSYSVGAVKNQPVIVNGNLVQDGVVYMTETPRQIWTGRVEAASPGVFFGISGQSRVPLVRQMVPNPKIQDYRVSSFVDKNILDLTSYDNSVIPSTNRFFREHVKDNLPQKDKSVYFSDIMISRSSQNECRLMLSVNLAKIIKENTKFPRILNNLPELLTSNFRILNFKILRRRIIKPQGFDSLAHDHKVDGRNITEFSKEQLVGSVGADFSKSHNTSYDIPHEVINIASTGLTLSSTRSETTNNSAKELKLQLGSNADQIKTISVNDTSISNDGAGCYQYGVELEIEDRIDDFIKLQLAELIEARDSLQQYLIIASQPVGNMKQGSFKNDNPHIVHPDEGTRASTGTNSQQFYNVHTNRFTDEFIFLMSESYSPGNAPWEVAAAKMHFFINDIMRAPATGIVNNIQNIASPSTGNPSGIQKALDVMDNMITSVTKFAGMSVTASSRPKGAGQRFKNHLSDGTMGSATASSIKKFKITHFFVNEIFDSSTPKQLGYDYLGLKNDNIAAPAPFGARIISAQAMAERLTQEKNKYFKADAQSSFELAGNRTNDNAYPSEPQATRRFLPILTNISNNEYQFLSPSKVVVGLAGQGQFGHLSINMLDVGVASQSSEGYPHQMFALLASVVANIKTPTAQPIVAPVSTGAGENVMSVVRDNLLDVLAEKGCTIMAASQRNVRQQRERFSGNLRRLNIPDTFGTNSQIDEQSRDVADLLDSRDSLIDSHTNRELDTHNPSMVYLKILSNLFLEADFGKVGQGRFANRKVYSLQNFKLSSQSNPFLFRGSLGVLAQQQGSRLPMQVKSLFLSSTRGLSSNINYNISFDTMERDLLQDPIAAISFFINFFSLVSIEFLSGYDRTPGNAASGLGGEALLNSPLWRSLDRAALDNLVQGQELVCRMRKYDNALFGVTSIPGLELPIFDRYFVIRNEQGRFVQPTVPNRGNTTSSIRNTINKRRAIINIPRELIRPSDMVAQAKRLPKKQTGMADARGVPKQQSISQDQQLRQNLSTMGNLNKGGGNYGR